MQRVGSSSASRRASPVALVVATLAAFATFGAFWGVWGASVPRIRDQAGLDDGELGFVLLLVGSGALPAMLLTGRAIDRWGLRSAAGLVAALGLSGAVASVLARDVASAGTGLLVVGMASGAADVAMNSVAGRAERVAGRPVITRAHGVLSGFVVVGSLGTAAASGAELPLAAPFVVVAVMSAVAGLAMRRTLPAGPVRSDEGVPAVRSASGSPARPFLLVGLLGALAFASEGAHQNWSALFARDVLGAGPGQAALAPALFATVVASTRLSLGGLGARHARLVLTLGGSVAAVGALVVSVADGAWTLALELVIAAAGTAVLFPTVLGIVSRSVEEARRGRATSLVTTISYLGFLLGPAYVGAWAASFDLRVAMVAVAALAAALAVLAPLLLRASGLGVRPSGGGEREAGHASPLGPVESHQPCLVGRRDER